MQKMRKSYYFLSLVPAECIKDLTRGEKEAKEEEEKGVCGEDHPSSRLLWPPSLLEESRNSPWAPAPPALDGGRY